MFDFTQIAIRAIVLLTALPLHEYAHGYVAYKLGDDTAYLSGRLTLNPMAHLDPLGSFALIFAGIGWAKPVPVNPMRFKNTRKGMALTAAAGPLSNLLVAIISYALAKVCVYLNFMFGGSVIPILLMLFRAMASINIGLAVFNLIPIPPFDGSRILNYFLPDKLYFKMMEYERYIFPILLIAVFFGVFDGVIGILANSVYFLVDKLTFFIDIIFKAIIF